MAKSKSKKQRSSSTSPPSSSSSAQSSLPSKSLDDSANNVNADDEVDGGDSSFTMIATAAADASSNAANTRHRHSSNSTRRSSNNMYINHHHEEDEAAAVDDNEDEYDIRKWTSRHYDNNDDDTDGNDDAEVERDLYDPNITTKNKRSLFDDGKNGGEGADEDGMFLSLEVIPGDAYRVEKTGRDKAGGYVTKIVYNTDSMAKADSKENTKEEKLKGGSDKKLDKKKERRKKQKEKKRELLKRKMTSDSDIDNDHDDTKDDDDRGVSTTSTKKKRAKSSTNSNDDDFGNDTPISEMDKESNDVGMPDENDEAITNLRTSWSIHAPGIVLHTTLCAGLVTLGYNRPTPIQSSSLPAAMLGRRDIVGAAPTGSGKTLGYGLPILQYLLEEADEMKEQEESATTSMGQQEGNDDSHRSLQALILVPTRELAMQVTSELTRVSCNKVKIGTIVGGFAEVKQRRTLEKVRPPIVVATPGRLWELMSSKDYTHLNNLAQLRFLVVDEADRMIKQGSFPQLQQIFEVINRANPPPSQDDDSDGDDSELNDDNDDHRLKSLSGVRGEAKVVMLNDSILAAIERERNNGGKGMQSDTSPVPMEMDDAEFEEQMQQIHNDGDGSEIDFLEENDNEDEPVHRQTFIYSATLTLPPSMHHLIKKDHAAKVKSKKKKGSNKQPTTVDGAIAEILDVAGARGEMKIVDLSNSIISSEGKKGKTSAKDAVEPKGNKTTTSRKSEDPSSLLTRLPPGLSLGEIRCAQMHKDSHLYAYLVTTRQGSSGPCLVFCNSIAAVRRVGETLQTLGLPAKMLHAQMAQKSRLAALESLRTANSRSIVVASDVAARGLDIASVTTVIHYDVARVVDTFIHRAGRTARGVGEKAIGTSISLVAPAEEREHQKICEAVRGSGSRSLELVQIDVRLLNEAQERVALASKIVSCHDVESQASKKNKWLQDAAKEAELELDEDMMEGGLLDGDQRDRQRFLEAKRAKSELQRLLAKPMRKQHFGKFLSGVGVRESIKSEGEVKPYIVKESSTGVKHRRKQPKKREK